MTFNPEVLQLITGVLDDERTDLLPGDPLYGLAALAWRHQDTSSLEERAAVFTDLESLWPRRSKRPRRDEQRIRIAAKLLAAGYDQGAIADALAIDEDSLRRDGIWGAARATIAGRQTEADVGQRATARTVPLPVLTVAVANAAGVVATATAGMLSIPRPGCVAVVEAGRPDLHYDRGSVLPRIHAPHAEDCRCDGCPSVPSSAGARLLPRPRSTNAQRREYRRAEALRATSPLTGRKSARS